MSFQFVNLHTHHQNSNENILSIVNQYPNEFNPKIENYSVGIHPWYIDLAQVDASLHLIENKSNEQGFLAIGECGLDKRIDQPMHIQMEVFKKQLLLAQTLNKPVIIHCVGAFQELIALKKELKLNIPLVVHGFSKSAEQAKQLVENGFYLSFGKYLIQNPGLKEVFLSVPNDRIFLETDVLDLNILDIYKLAADYKAIDLVVLQSIIKNNFSTVFKQL